MVSIPAAVTSAWQWITSPTVPAFLVRFVLWLIPLFLLWSSVGGIYVRLLTLLAAIPFGLAGMGTTYTNQSLLIQVGEQQARMDLAGAVMVDFNITPFFALILATTASRGQKLQITIAGLTAMAVFHSLILFAQAQYAITQATGYAFINNLTVILNPAIPFLVWFLLTDQIQFPGQNTHESASAR